MARDQGDIPALESGMAGLCVALSSPAGIARHNISYDEHMDIPMHHPPADMTVNNFWKDPLIPRHRFRNKEVSESGDKITTCEASLPPKSPVLVVKAKASSLMSSLMSRQSQENLQKFEHQAGLTEAVYSPHKGLTAEETQFHRVADGKLPKLRMPGDFKEDRLSTSAQSTPSGTPTVTPSVTPSATPVSSPAVSRRNWFQLNPTHYITAPEPNRPDPYIDMGGNEGGGGPDKWNFFGTRSVVHKSPTDPGSDTSTGFSLQSYFGLHKSSTMDGTNTQMSQRVEEPAKFMPPKIEISDTESKRVSPRPHKLKPRDMNVLTPSGF
ncbi:putative monooxygenase p33MONOX [Poeciliopsis prolifica]|uniref:putative monooxygenase p33MONOX n=1 Tax=Poeciliopsis prolifica TaxID=188132 RepID=UPI00241332BA|nr:putative monooxygenase p33MONOX [Poeciliopsis prolifica]XP_054890043.1 putative monooxygenase p33MONOX [Poeciliopsis prolifica]